MSPDGAHVAFPQPKDFSTVMLVDGKAGPEYDQVSDFAFGSDGKCSLYLAQKDGRSLLCWLTPQGTRTFDCDELQGGGSEVSFWGNKVRLKAWSADLSQGLLVKKPQEHDFLIEFLPDGRTAGPFKGGRDRIALTALVVTPDARHCAHLGWKDRHPIIGVDGKIVYTGEKETMDVEDLGISSDGKHIAWTEGGVRYLDGKQVDGSGRAVSHRFVFSQDSQHLIWWRAPEREGGDYEVLVDGQTSFRSQGGSFFVSPDSKAVGMQVVKNGRTAIMIRPMPGAKIEPGVLEGWDRLGKDIRPLASGVGARFGPTYETLAVFSGDTIEVSGRKYAFTCAKGRRPPGGWGTEIWSPKGKHLILLGNDQSNKTLRVFADGREVGHPLRVPNLAKGQAPVETIRFEGEDQFSYVGFAEDSRGKPEPVRIKVRFEQGTRTGTSPSDSRP